MVIKFIKTHDDSLTNKDGYDASVVVNPGFKKPEWGCDVHFVLMILKFDQVYRAYEVYQFLYIILLVMIYS